MWIARAYNKPLPQLFPLPAVYGERGNLCARVFRAPRGNADGRVYIYIYIYMRYGNFRVAGSSANRRGNSLNGRPILNVPAIISFPGSW